MNNSNVGIYIFLFRICFFFVVISSREKEKNQKSIPIFCSQIHTDIHTFYTKRLLQNPEPKITKNKFSKPKRKRKMYDTKGKHLHLQRQNERRKTKTVNILL